MLVSNYPAIIVAAVVAMAVGSLWYSPFLFGKPWMAALGKDPGNMKGMPFPMKEMGIQLVASAVMAYVVAHFTFIWHLHNVRDALAFGFLVWLGFYATTTLGSVLWEGRPWKLYGINVSQQLVSVLLVTLTVALWQ